MTVMEPVIEWILECPLRQITLVMVMEGANRPRRPVLRVLDRLVSEGSLVEISDGKIPCRYGEVGRDRRNPVWRIEGKEIVLPNRQAPGRTLRDRVWQIIRARRRFTLSQIVRLSGGAYGAVRMYIGKLERDGFVRRTGRDGHKITYLLVRGTKLVVRPVTRERA